MNPVTHLLMSWVAANAARLPKRDRLLVTCAGIIPDLDGLGVVVEYASEKMGDPIPWYTNYHHVLGHNMGFGLLLVAAGFAFAVKRLRTVIMITFVFHLHILGDIAGSRGPDGYQWPIPYLLPFSNEQQLTWSSQWELNAWPNILITVILIMTTFYLAWRRGYSPLEMVSQQADKKLVNRLRRRFGAAAK